MKPVTMSGGAVSVGQGKAGDAGGDQDCRRDGRVACRPRLRRSPRERDHDGEARDRPPRPPGGGGRADDRQQDDQREQPPRQVEPVDAMIDGGLERRREEDPERRVRPASRPVRRSFRRRRRWPAARDEGASSWRRRQRAFPVGEACAARRRRSLQRRSARPAAGRRSRRRTSPTFAGTADIAAALHRAAEGGLERSRLGSPERVERIAGRADQHRDRVRAH